jgi:hypothetical protein
MAKPSQPYLLDLQFRGFAQGLTYLTSQSQPQPSCHYFGGVPYALPPVGPFRFQKPRSLPPCYRYGTKANPGHFTGSCGLCPQPSTAGGEKTAKASAAWEEDCLQSNIWIPAGDAPSEGSILELDVEQWLTRDKVGRCCSGSVSDTPTFSPL